MAKIEIDCVAKETDAKREREITAEAGKLAADRVRLLAEIRVLMGQLQALSDGARAADQLLSLIGRPLPTFKRACESALESKLDVLLREVAAKMSSGEALGARINALAAEVDEMALRERARGVASGPAN